MRKPALSWFRLTFPSELDVEAVEALLRAINGLSVAGRTRPFIFECVATHQEIAHYLACPRGLSSNFKAFVSTTIPGLRLEKAQRPRLPEVRTARRLWLSTSRRPLEQGAAEAVSTALLSTLSTPRRGEAIVTQLIVGPVRRALTVGSKHVPVTSENWAWALLTAPLLGPRDMDSEAVKALREKQGSHPGWRAVGRVAVAADSAARRQQILRDLMGAYRTADRAGAQFGSRSANPRVVLNRSLPWFWGLALNVPELAGLIAWPYSELHGVPVARRRARHLPVPTSTPRRGRILEVVQGTRRPIAVSAADLTTHTWAVGPTGVGKSTLLLNMIVQDMSAGRSIFVIEPKEDLIQDVLARVPDHRRTDVVVFDHSRMPVGFNPLVTNSPELTADQILSVFARLNTDSWGPRLGELLHAALLTLARTPGMSLAALPLLFTNDGFRRRVVGTLDDPLGVSPIWTAFDRMSVEARVQATASVLNKVRPMVGRQQMRGILGQAEPRFSLKEAFSGRRIVLVDLAKGRIGPDSARLLGTLFLNALWQACLTRTQVAPERRHVVGVYVDELQDYVGLPADLGEMLAQARGLGIAFTLANQHARQLPAELQAGVLSNARTRVVFQTDSSDGALLAKGQRLLTAEDFSNLPSREVYVRLSRNAEVTPYMSGVTLPPPAVTSDPAALRQQSAARFGVDRLETDRALRALVEGQRLDAPVGHRRRVR